jgi:hypothetical protein
MRDISYIYIHFLLFILTMSFAGDLLRAYPYHGVLGRIEIVTLFALAGSFFQVTLLHFIPNIARLVFVSSLNTNTFLTLLKENVAKSGVVVFAVFILEVLLCWVNFGQFMFSHAYKLNSPWFWGFVVIAGALHVCVLENYALTPEDNRGRSEQGSDLSSMATSESHQGTELRSLTEESSGPGMPQDHPISPMSNIDLGSESSTRAQVVPGYGSAATQDTGASLSPEISSTFISSWAAQLIQLQLLVDLLLVSWAVWVARHNIATIFKLSPLSPGLVWGFFPLWALDVFLVTLVGILVYAFCKWKQQKGLELQRIREDIASSSGRLAVTPLLG